MTKNIQNIVADSRKTLPFVLAYGLLVWFCWGALHPVKPLDSQGSTAFAWLQLVCFLLSAMLMMFFNSLYALIRVYSRSVSCTFILLSCAACFQFGSLEGHILTLCILSAFLLLFRTFQDDQSPGWAFYAFLCLGLASLAFIHVVAYIPLFWVFMIFQLNSAGWRTLIASVFGLLTPYWFVGAVLVAIGNVQPLIVHLKKAADWQVLTGYDQLTVNQVLTFILIVVFGITGIIHFLRNSYADKIRTRMFYTCFIFTTLLTMTFIALAPAYCDELLRILIISTSPLIGHFIALTHTRVTNVAFIAGAVLTFLLTLLNLWMPSLNF